MLAADKALPSTKRRNRALKVASETAGWRLADR
jgi:hypothetical protein